MSGKVDLILDIIFTEDERGVDGLDGVEPLMELCSRTLYPVQDERLNPCRVGCV